MQNPLQQSPSLSQAPPRSRRRSGRPRRGRPRCSSRRRRRRRRSPLLAGAVGADRQRAAGSAGAAWQTHWPASLHACPFGQAPANCRSSRFGRSWWSPRRTPPCRRPARRRCSRSRPACRRRSPRSRRRRRRRRRNRPGCPGACSPGRRSRPGRRGNRPSGCPHRGEDAAHPRVARGDGAGVAAAAGDRRGAALPLVALGRLAGGAGGTGHAAATAVGHVLLQIDALPPADGQLLLGDAGAALRSRRAGLRGRARPRAGAQQPTASPARPVRTPRRVPRVARKRVKSSKRVRSIVCLRGEVP